MVSAPVLLIIIALELFLRIEEVNLWNKKHENAKNVFTFLLYFVFNETAVRYCCYLWGDRMRRIRKPAQVHMISAGLKCLKRVTLPTFMLFLKFYAVKT